VVKDLKEQGLSIREIAEKIGIPRATVGRVVKHS
jgi:transposase